MYPQDCLIVSLKQVKPVKSDATYSVLLVEDSDTDAFLLERALKRNGIKMPIERVTDGMEAIEYLSGEGKYGDRSKYPVPEVLFVDLKMPRVSGLELLTWLRDHQEFTVIPTIIMSSSNLDKDVNEAYDLGANTYFVKPTDFDQLATLVKAIYDYWARGIKPRNLKLLSKK